MLISARRSLGLLVLGVAASFPVHAQSAVLNVPGQYATIQAAVDAATAGDTVLIADGTYSGPGNYDIDVGGLNIVVRSQNGPDNCIIDCQQAGRGFDNATWIEGLTILNAATTGYGGGVRCAAGNPLIRDCVIMNCSAYNGAGIWSQSGALTVERCELINNYAQEAGGGVYCRAATISNCTLTGNAARWGGGLHLGDDADIRSCILSANNADGGGAIRIVDASVTVRNCTLANNTAVYNGGAVLAQSFNVDSNPQISSSILWDNNAGDSGPELCLTAGTGDTITMTVDYSIVDGGQAAVCALGSGTNTLVWGSHNLEDDPLLGADLHLTAGSPAVDAGDPYMAPEPAETDIDGEARIGYCRVDAGADESPFFVPGCVGNGQTDACNITSGVSQDCNGNLVPDECDVAQATSSDCNANIVPDECETDCNANTVPDDCDIAAGSSTDCNANGVPDECMAFEADCNANNTPDACDIAAGTSLDTDSNGLPDECQLYVDVAACPAGGSGTPADPFCHVQTALSAASDGFIITLAPGTYSGPGNYNLDFGIGLPASQTKDVTLRSTDPTDPQVVAATVLDAQQQGSVLVFSRNETPEAVVDGLTITGGLSTLGGGIYIGNPTSSNPTIRNCVVTGNFATVHGGGIYISNSSPLIENCTIAANEGDYFAGRGGGIYVAGGAPTLRNCVIRDNVMAGNGGGLYGSGSSVAVLNGLIADNVSGGSGGGLYFTGLGSPSLVSSIVSGNQATFDGGGMVFAGTSFPVVRNCWIVNNAAAIGDGGGVFNYNKADLTISGTTIAYNVAPDGLGGGIAAERESTVVVTNSTLWADTAQNGAEISLIGWPPATMSVSYSNVAGGPAGVNGSSNLTWDAASNIVADPLFVNAAVGSYHLLDQSPGVDAGDPAFAAGVDETDVDGDPRTIGGRVDMGGDEFNPDCNANGLPDDQDILGGAADCNGNGIPDECIALEGDCNANAVPDDCDLAYGTSADCNANGMPDECEVDCNTNGTPDDCDIATAVSTDCNTNAIPDECDIATGASPDCNANALPDECDLASGTSLDCNANNTPDECDLTTGASVDCNANTIPDECETDCNRNGIPDDCDLGSGTAEDCNTNGIPDICEVRLHVAVSGNASQGFLDGITASGHLVTSFGILGMPQDLSIFDVFVVAPLSGASLPDGAAAVDTFVASGGGLIIIEGAYQLFAGQASPVLSKSGLALRSGTTVVDPADPIADGLPIGSTLAGNSVVPTLKSGAYGPIEWDDGVPMTVTYAHGDGQVVYFNDEQACFNDANWQGDPVYGTALMHDAVVYVGGTPAADCDGNDLPDDCELAAGSAADCNANGLLDQCEHQLMSLGDFALQASCLTGPGCSAAPCDPPLYADPSCCIVDLDLDGDVDLRDYGWLQIHLGQ